MDTTDLVQRLRRLDRPAEPSESFRNGLWELLEAASPADTSAVRPPATKPGKHGETIDVAPSSLPLRQRRATGIAAAAAAFVLVAGSGAVTWWLSPGRMDGATETVPASTRPETPTTDRPDSPPASVAASSLDLPPGRFPLTATSDGERVWVLTGTEPQESGAPPLGEAILLAVDPRTGDISVEAPLEDSPSIVAGDPTGVWVAHWETGAVTRVDPVTGNTVASIALELPFDIGSGPDRRLFIPNDVVIGHGSVWVSTARGAVARIDIATNEVSSIIERTPALPAQLAIGSTGVWVAEDVHGLTHIDAATETVSTVPLAELDHAAQRVAVHDGDVYVAGDRLGRNPDGSFRLEAGGYVVGDETAISRIEADTRRVVGSTVFDEPIVFVGWVNAFFGAVDGSGTFWHIGALPELIGNTSSTNWRNHPIVQVGREAWMVDTAGTRLLRVDETGPRPIALPIEIAELSEPRPVDAEWALSRDWEPLAAGPLGPRWPAVIAWTGQEIVLWGGEPVGGGGAMRGGAAYRPATNSWRELSGGPLTSTAEAAWVWTDDELVIWNDGPIAAAWQPDTNTWRTIDDWPLRGSPYRRAAWTGEGILDADRGLIVDPRTGDSRPIAEPPSLHQRATVVWADGDHVVVTGDGSYNLQADTWTDMPPSGLTPLATSGTWTGIEVVAVDYEMRSAGYDPSTNSWTRYPDVPLRFSECAPRAHTLLGRPVVEHCSGIAVWDPGHSTWIPLAFPQPLVSTQLISTGSELYAWGEGLYRLGADATGAPLRLTAGISLLDLPPGWTATSSTGGPAIALELEAINGDRCTVRDINADAESVLASYVTEPPTVVQLAPNVGGKPSQALRATPGQLDSLHHLVWSSGTRDVIDVACTTAEASELIATQIWSPYQ